MGDKGGTETEMDNNKGTRGDRECQDPTKSHREWTYGGGHKRERYTIRY